MKKYIKAFENLLNKFSNNPNSISKNGNLFEVDCWKLSELLLKKVIPVIGIHPYPLNEQLLMASAVAYSKPDVIVEWGTHYGKSARLFWEIVVALKLKTEIFTVDVMDPNHPEFPGSARGKYLSNTEVKQIVGDGLSEGKKLLMNNQKPALIYIDGDHTRESVKKDLTIWENLPSGSGILAHDVFYQDPSDYNVGPYISVQEFIKEHKSEISQIQWQLLGLPGMVFLQKK